jgi:ubiquinone/menaquinone biosynthesis C-methylase UbiE
MQDVLFEIEAQVPEFPHDEYVPALRYRWLTPYYDALVGATTREKTFKKALIDQANLKSGHRVLDLACGTGTLSIWIKDAHPHTDVTGIDGDTDILSIAAKKAHQAATSINFKTAMSYDIPYPDEYFDRVVSSLFFHHLSMKNKIRTTTEIYRILKPGGQLHVADWGKAENPGMSKYPGQRRGKTLWYFRASRVRRRRREADF